DVVRAILAAGVSTREIVISVPFATDIVIFRLDRTRDSTRGSTKGALRRGREAPDCSGRRTAGVLFVNSPEIRGGGGQHSGVVCGAGLVDHEWWRVRGAEAHVMRRGATSS